MKHVAVGRDSGSAEIEYSIGSFDGRHLGGRVIDRGGPGLCARALAKADLLGVHRREHFSSRVALQDLLQASCVRTCSEGVRC